MSPEPLPAEIVHEIAAVLTKADEAFIIGGQAVNLWAERFHANAAAELSEYAPYTSKDLDYFGYLKAAQKLGAAIGGKVRTPKVGDHTPEAAIVEAEIAGHHVEIDFLAHVLGVDEDRLKASAVDLILQVKLGETVSPLHVPIMHPLHCLQSKLANRIKLGRRDGGAVRQLEATPIILREFINELLETGRIKDAQATLKRLYEYLRSDMYGRKAHREMDNDPIAVLDKFIKDERLDPRYREKTLTPMRDRVVQRRRRLGFLWAFVGSEPAIEQP